MGARKLAESGYPGYPLRTPEFIKIDSVKAWKGDGVIVQLTPRFFTDATGVVIATEIAIARFRIMAAEQGAAPWLLDGGSLSPPLDVFRAEYEINWIGELYIEGATADAATTGVSRPVRLQYVILGGTVGGDANQGQSSA